MTWNRHLAAFAAFNGAMAVAVGAFGAHGAGAQIKSLLTTGASYQLAHAVFALACAAVAPRVGLAAVAGWVGSAGGLVFCLSLVASALLDIVVGGLLAPIGGFAMIIGWLILGFAALRSSSVNV